MQDDVNDITSEQIRSKVVFERSSKRHHIPGPALLKKFKRDRHKTHRVSVFRYAYYDPAFKFFVEQVLDCEYLALPPSTKRTMELGIQNSADDVCTPFKHMMGDWIEALELGADILVQVGLAGLAITARRRNRYCVIWAMTSRCSTSPTASSRVISAGAKKCSRR